MMPLPETVLKKNRFPDYFAVTSLCVECQESKEIFVPSEHFFNFGNIQKSQWAKSGD
jgi:hypothetical protein